MYPPPPYFRQQLTGGDEEPDLTLLSVVAGCVENCMTAIKVAPSQTSQVRQPKEYLLAAVSFNCLEMRPGPTLLY